MPLGLVEFETLGIRRPTLTIVPATAPRRDVIGSEHRGMTQFLSQERAVAYRFLGQERSVW
jgi:hypothetical protein